MRASKWAHYGCGCLYTARKTEYHHGPCQECRDREVAKLTPGERHDLYSGFSDLDDAATLDEAQEVLDAYEQTVEYQTAYERMLAVYPEE